MIHRCTNGTLIEVGKACCYVTLPSGHVIRAMPQNTPAQAATALCMGYGDDVGAMTEDHDAMHAWLTDALGLSVSQSLRNAAGLSHDESLAFLEETAVMAVQTLMKRAGGKMPFGRGA
jgi:hypothetical protein